MTALQALMDWAAQHIDDEPPNEYEDALRRAFVDNRADFITLDSNPRGQKFLAASTLYAIRHGWLYCDQATGDTLSWLERPDGGVEITDRFSQSEIYSFRLTEAGRAHFGLS